MKTIWFMLNTCFSSGIWVCAGQRDQPLVKYLCTESNKLSWLGIFHMSQFLAGGIKSILCEKKFVPSLPSISSHALFPFADCALFHFVIINHSLEYGYILSPVSPPSKPLNLGVVLVTFRHIRKMLCLTLKETAYQFSKVVDHLAFPPAINESSICSTS